MDEFRIWVERPEGGRFFDLDAVLRVKLIRGYDSDGGRVLLEEHQEFYRGKVDKAGLEKIRAYNPELVKYLRNIEAERFERWLGDA